MCTVSTIPPVFVLCLKVNKIERRERREGDERRSRGGESTLSTKPSNGSFSVVGLIDRVSAEEAGGGGAFTTSSFVNWYMCATSEHFSNVTDLNFFFGDPCNGKREDEKEKIRMRYTQ